MIPFKTLMVIDKAAATPAYIQIANCIIQNIRRGHPVTPAEFK
jgi:hypothetical protein